MHPYTSYTLATQRQADLIGEADRERLARSARKSTNRPAPSPARRLVAAAAAAALALTITGAAFAAQNGTPAAGSVVNHGGEQCVAIGDYGALAC